MSKTTYLELTVYSNEICFWEKEECFCMGRKFLRVSHVWDNLCVTSDARAIPQTVEACLSVYPRKVGKKKNKKLLFSLKYSAMQFVSDFYVSDNTKQSTNLV